MINLYVNFFFIYLAFLTYKYQRYLTFQNLKYFFLLYINLVLLFNFTVFKNDNIYLYKKIKY